MTNPESDFWGHVIKSPDQCWPGLTVLLANHYPELAKLAELLGDQAKTFLDHTKGRH
jgi:hypothetical protein